MYFCNMIFRHLLNMRSHPTWVRGLKLGDIPYLHDSFMSHPTWVRGLKLNTFPRNFTRHRSHPTWVRGLKQVLRGFAV